MIMMQNEMLVNHECKWVDTNEWMQMNDCWWIDAYELGGQNLGYDSCPIFKYLYRMTWVMAILLKSGWKIFKYRIPEFCP